MDTDLPQHAMAPARREGGLRTLAGPACAVPVASVITVVFNGAKTIEKTIQSVLDQSCEGVEHIIIDGGSTDVTVEIIRKYEDRVAYWLSEPDKGIYDAMNKGIALARADVVGILNADDTYTPDAVRLAVQALEREKRLGYCYGWLLLHDAADRPLGLVKPVPQAQFADRVLRETALPHPTMFVRRAVYLAHGAFDARLRLAGDFELIARLFRAGVQGGEIPHVMAHFLIGGASANPLILREQRQVAIGYGAPSIRAWADWAVARAAMALRTVLPSRAAGLMRQFKQRFLLGSR